MIGYLIFVFSLILCGAESKEPVNVAMIDTGISQEFMKKTFNLITYLDFTDDEEMFTRDLVKSHSEKLISLFEKHTHILLLKVQSKSGEITIQNLERAMKFLLTQRQGKFQYVNFALSTHILDDNQLEQYTQLTKLIERLTLKGACFIAATSNFPFIKSYPSILPFVIKIGPDEDYSASINTIKYLNSRL